MYTRGMGSARENEEAMKQETLFGALKPAKPRVVRAHTTDSGPADGGKHMATFTCRKCGTVVSWLVVTTKDVRRGVPCPTCCPGEWQKWHG